MKRVISILVFTAILCYATNPVLMMQRAVGVKKAAAGGTVDVAADTSGFNENTSVISYATARDDDAADTYAFATLGVGQRYIASVYTVWRTVIGFSVPAGIGTISAVTLNVYGHDNDTEVDFDLYVVGAVDAASELTVDDFSHFDGRQTGGAHNGTVLNDTWNTVSYDNDLMTIVFNASGIDSVTSAIDGTLWIALISGEDYDNSSPSLALSERIEVESHKHLTEYPYLHITYTGP